MDEKINLLNYSVEELETILVEAGLEKFRAKQIFQWLHKGVKKFEDMSNLSKALREKLSAIAYISELKIQHKRVSAIDGTVKYLFQLEEGNVIESVLMEYKHGFTACISSQVGCKMGCSFCASTGIGYMRNLSSGEILDQILAIQKDSRKRVGNIVIMGIGEPFDNYEQVIKFLKIVNSSDGLNIGYRRITLSTCGLVPQILKFSKEMMPVNLSISLHAPNDVLREQMMPVNKKYAIDKLIEACKIYTEATNRRITFEYAMVAGVNDSEQLALELAGKIKGMLCHVNLIPVNQVEGLGYRRTGRQQIEKFKAIIEKFGIETTIRRELGTDISAACGQLRRSAINDSQM